MDYGSDRWWYWLLFCAAHWVVYIWRTQGRWLAPLMVKACHFLLVGSAVVLIFSILIAPCFPPRYPLGPVTLCKSNLKNIGTASEMYATDNAGDYAPRLFLLTPNYLKTIPTCASAGEETYSHGYVAINKHGKSDAYNAYTVVCRGEYHAGVNLGPNYPQYTSAQGLISM